jgi:CheY-like chemotaxis protein
VKRRILIVDDSETFLTTFREILCRRFPGYEIAAVDNGDAAFQRICEMPPHLVFLDMRLAEESGLAVTGRIKARFPDVPVVVLTEYDLPEYREAALVSGADEYACKGTLELSEITSIVERLCAPPTPEGEKIQPP